MAETGGKLQVVRRVPLVDVPAHHHEAEDWPESAAKRGSELMKLVDKLIGSGWTPWHTRPLDGEVVAYLFGPLNTLHVGTYSAADDSVCGGAGFTTWYPCVMCWCLLPGVI
jgi:hypothetical protein